MKETLSAGVAIAGATAEADELGLRAEALLTAVEDPSPPERVAGLRRRLDALHPRRTRPGREQCGLLRRPDHRPRAGSFRDGETARAQRSAAESVGAREAPSVVKEANIMTEPAFASVSLVATAADS